MATLPGVVHALSRQWRYKERVAADRHLSPSASPMHKRLDAIIPPTRRIEFKGTRRRPFFFQHARIHYALEAYAMAHAHTFSNIPRYRIVYLHDRPLIVDCDP